MLLIVVGSETFPRASAPAPSIAAASDYSSAIDSSDLDSLLGIHWLASIMDESQCHTFSRLQLIHISLFFPG